MENNISGYMEFGEKEMIMIIPYTGGTFAPSNGAILLETQIIRED